MSLTASGRSRTMVIAFAMLFTLAVPSAGSASEIPASLNAILVERENLGMVLAHPIAACVVRHDTAHPVFHGCLDWHSAVHGHWALMALDRALPDFTVPTEVQSAFAGNAILQELVLLKRDPEFEMPYGRAWFLRLAIEHMKHGNVETARRLADPVLESLMSHFARHGINMSSRNYLSATWALVNMLDYTGHAGLTRERNRILAQIDWESDIWQMECSYDAENELFMAICTNLALLASRVLDPDEFRTWAASYVKSVGLPSIVSEPLSCHHYGLSFSRAWGLWELYSATGDLAIADSYSAHFLAGIGDVMSGKEDYRCAGHWVTQFGVFALQPLFGDEKGR